MILDFPISGVLGENNHSDDIPIGLNPAGYVIKAFFARTRCRYFGI